MLLLCGVKPWHFRGDSLVATRASRGDHEGITPIEEKGTDGTAQTYLRFDLQFSGVVPAVGLYEVHVMTTGVHTTSVHTWSSGRLQKTWERT